MLPADRVKSVLKKPETIGAWHLAQVGSLRQFRGRPPSLSPQNGFAREVPGSTKLPEVCAFPDAVGEDLFH